MAGAKATLRTEVLTRLGDLAQRVWTHAEVEDYLDEGLRHLSRLRLWWDTVYAENLPPTFSQTAAWETAWSDVFTGTANHTMDDERTLGGEETSRVGPAWTTGVFEATDGYLDDLGARADVPATSELPARVLEVERGVWDGRGVDAYAPADFARLDARYEITRGEVYGYIWRKDGTRTLRKVRVPAAMAATHDVTGAWGLLREPTDISGDSVVTAGPYGGDVLAEAATVAYWRLGEASGATVAVDATGHGHDGTYVNAPTLGVDGAIVASADTAVSLAAASSQYVTIPDDVDLRPATFSVEVWFRRADRPGDYRTLLSKVTTDGWDDGWMFFIAPGANDKIRFFANMWTSPVTSGVFSLDVWHQAVGTFDGDTARLYLDGVEVGTPVTGITLVASTSPVLIGADVPASAFWWDGDVDEVVISSGVRTAAEVLARYTLSLQTGRWGVPRWLPGEHPIGFTSWGWPRRVYRDGTNVRIEHYRQARPFDDQNGPSELPDRWGGYLRHYALSRCLTRQSAGQDLTLGAWYGSLWARALQRLQRRLDRRWRDRTAVMGGAPRRTSVSPPRPRLPWNYGARTRP